MGALVLAVLALELGKRAGGHEDSAGAAQTNATTTTTTQSRSNKPFVWKVSLDPTGRPYDERSREVLSDGNRALDDRLAMAFWRSRKGGQPPQVTQREKQLAARIAAPDDRGRGLSCRVLR